LIFKAKNKNYFKITVKHLSGLICSMFKISGMAPVFSNNHQIIHTREIKNEKMSDMQLAD